MLSEEQTKQIKSQILKQVENFPEDKREIAEEKIRSMNSEELEEFLIQNNLIKSSIEEKAEQKCIFCSIISNEIPSYKIDENKDSVAVLEINPISNGHILVIPNKHLSSKEEIPKTIFSLAKKISKKIKTKLKPKEVQIFSSNVLGHEIINLLPIYEKENAGSPRKKISPEELLKIQEILKTKPKKKAPEKKHLEVKEPEKNLWLPIRIP